MTLHVSSGCEACAKADMVDAIGNPYYPQVTAKSGHAIEFDGVPALLAAGNDYLDLATDPRVQQAAHDAIDYYGVGVPSDVPGVCEDLSGDRRVRQAAHDAVDLYGVGMTGSPLMNGYLGIHHDLEEEIAAWVGKEAALVFTADDLAAVGTLTQLIMLNRDTAVIAEDVVQDRLMDGVRIMRPRWTGRFGHDDLPELRQRLEEASRHTSHILVVVECKEPGRTDSLSLREICALAQEFDAEIFLHDPHGIVGREGSGALLGLADRIHYISGTFGGSFGASGAFLATSRETVKHLAAQCQTRMFAASLPPLLTAAARSALAVTRHGRRSRDGSGAVGHQHGGDATRWNGYLAMRAKLARDLAGWAGKEAGMVFAAGYLANVRGLSQIIQMNPDTTVISDKSAHASLIDGIRLGHPRRTAKFAHNDLDDLRHKLAEAKKHTDRVIIVVEGAYSVEGDLTPLPGIVALATEFDAEIFLDGAHGVGVVGGGRGTAASFGLADKVDYITGTFSKAFGSTGGFLLASADVIDRLDTYHPADPATALAPALIAAAQRSLDIMKEEPYRGTRAQATADTLRTELNRIGFEASGVTPIVSVSLRSMLQSAHSPEVLAITHDNPRRQALEREKARLYRDTVGTVQAHNWLLSQHGVYTNAFIAPGVDEPVLRVSATAGFTSDDVNTIVDAFIALRAAYPDLDAEAPASRRAA
ncbi:aminotransferase class I/II-fold pyridoxal phosphate-dependent enzyme [Streptomyces wuyuanensis]|uniref:aminotransferase class I/II-fold pyridoxal phosphate-dependent enzyme n=1 Tax=Streptomyces wuyuanensis TaxID=1196353 RepID=UPI00343C1BF9